MRVLETRERLPATNERVDVYGALAWLDVRVVFKPLEGLVGAYVRGETPGVMVSTRRPPSVQRFTAAHELGHAVLGHAPSLDSPGVIGDAASGRPRPLIGGFASYLQEVEADAFAGGFLLPPWLIARHARRQGWTRAMLSQPGTVYQLSLRCGASFQAVSWALERNGFIPPADREALLRFRPRDLKARLGHGGGDADARSDAWLIGAQDSGLDLEVVVGDTISINHATLGKVSGAPDTSDVLRPLSMEPSSLEAGDRFIVERRGATRIRLHGADGSAAERAIGISVVERESGLSRANRARLASRSIGGRLDRAA